MIFTTKDLLERHTELCVAAQMLMERKNNDYAGSGGQSPFKNFVQAEALGLCSTEVGMMVRLSDKMQRLAHALSGQEMKVSDESLQDTVLDIINYTVLIEAYIHSKKEEA